MQEPNVKLTNYRWVLSMLYLY